MPRYISDIEKQILEKNALLDELKSDPKGNKDEMEKVKRELDKLLYTYYKSLRCRCNNTMVLWTAAI